MIEKEIENITRSNKTIKEHNMEKNMTDSSFVNALNILIAYYHRKKLESNAGNGDWVDVKSTDQLRLSALFTGNIRVKKRKKAII